MLKVIAAALSLLGVSALHADFLGASACISHYFTLKNGNMFKVDGRFEHFIPIAPNGRAFIEKATDPGLNFERMVGFGYYEALDNGTVSLDIGGGLSRYTFKTPRTTHTDSATSLMPTYMAEAVLFEDQPIHYYGRFSKGGSLLGSTAVRDIEVGIRVVMARLALIELGYRDQRLTLAQDEPNIDMKGLVLSYGLKF